MAKNENGKNEKKVEQVAMYGNEWYESAIKQHPDAIKADEENSAATEFKTAGNEKKWAMKKQAYYFYMKRANVDLTMQEIVHILPKELYEQLSDNAKAMLMNEKKAAGGGSDIFDYYIPTGHGRAPIYLFMYMLADGGRISPITTKEAVMAALMEGTMKQRMNLEGLLKKVQEKGKGYSVKDGFVVAE